MGRADRCGGKQRSHASIEPGQRVELVAARADGLGIGVLIDELRGVCLLGLLDRGVALTGSHIRYTSKGLSVMTDWTIVLNVATSAMGSASLRVALLTFALCTKSAIVLSSSRPWALGLNITL